jgi:hypothetical protein
VVAKHRRSEYPSLASVGASTRTGEFGREPAGYSQATAWPAGYGYAPSRDYDTPADPGWRADPEEWFWQDGRNWGPPPALHPDHPSAPVPRIQFPADHPSGPMWAVRGPAGPGGLGPRGPAAPSPRGPGRARDSGRHESVTTTAAVGYLTVHREVSDFEHHHERRRRRATGYQREAGPRPGADYPGDAGRFGPGADYPGDAGRFGPGAAPPAAWLQDDRSARPEPVVEWFEDEHSSDEDPLWMAGQVLTLADDKAARVAQEAQDDAAAVRAAAEREAAAIREAAQREATELRARLDSILGGELGEVVANYITKSLALPPALPATAVVPTSARAELTAEPALPRRTSALPATMPARPGTAPGTRPARPATAPKRSPTKPAGKPPGKPVTKDQRQGRQKRAMRIAKYGTAAVLMLALGAAGLEIQHNGYSFFVFRENGQGDSPSPGPGRAGVADLDTQFLAQQAKVAQQAKSAQQAKAAQQAQAAQRAKTAHQAPKGRHHKTSPPAAGTTAKSTTNG